jgi:hypothetical protein
MKNFPEDQPIGSFANPILVEEDDNEGISSLQRSEEAQQELMLRFTTYRGYNA